MPIAEPMRLLRIRQVEDLVALKKSAIYQLIAEDNFPRPVAVGPRIRAWRSEDVAAWIDQRPYTVGNAA